MTTIEFINHINNLRKENKNNWYYFTGIVNDKQVKIKGYNTWLQIFTVNDINVPSGMDISVREFNNILQKAIEGYNGKL